MNHKKYNFKNKNYSLKQKKHNLRYFLFYCMLLELLFLGVYIIINAIGIYDTPLGDWLTAVILFLGTFKLFDLIRDTMIERIPLAKYFFILVKVAFIGMVLATTINLISGGKVFD